MPDLQELFARYLCPWRGPPPAVLRYALCTSGFMDDVTFAHIDHDFPGISDAVATQYGVARI